MNKSQRVLTIIALAVFVVIGACHYLAWPPILFYDSVKVVDHTEWKHLTGDEIKRYNDPSVLPSDEVWIPVPAYASKTYWHPPRFNPRHDYAMVPDVRMPFFMLGVIYAGLFFLLADKKKQR
jgi:hypothetical protein